MRITAVVNLPVILLVLAVGAVAVPAPKKNEPLFNSTSLSHFFFIIAPPFFTQLVDRQGLETQ